MELKNKLLHSNIEYKASDFKPEVHFIGQIVGASNILDSDGIFLEAFFEFGNEWKCLSPLYTVQTQTCYTNVGDFVAFAHQLDLHFTTQSLFGWPKLVARMWKLDETNKIDLCNLFFIQ